MEKTVIFSESQKATSSDLNEIGAFGRESLDHAIQDGVGGRSGYTGFNAVKTAQTIVTVGDGRLWKDGGAYFSNQSGGVALNFLTALPLTLKRYAAIVVVAQVATPTRTEQREFLSNAETRQVEGRAVATESWRTVALSYVAGTPAAQPEKFTVEPQYTIVAWALLDTTSVVSVEMEESTRWRSAQDAFDKADAAARAVGVIDARTLTTDAELARLAALVAQRADGEAFYRTQVDLARVKEKLDIPESFIDYGGDNFLDEVESDKTETGYAAKIADGLRFPDAAVATSALTLLNPLDPQFDVIVNGGVTTVLPASAEFRNRIVPAAGNSNEIALNQGNFDTSSITLAVISPRRDRYGDEFVISGADAFWNTGRYLDTARGIFLKDGQEYQVYPSSGKINADGVRLYRIRRRWTDTVDAVYWTRPTTAPTLTNAGHKIGQAFKSASDRWITAIGIHPTRLDSSGTIKVTLYRGLENGPPDEKQAITTSSVDPATLLPNQFNRVAVPPTFLKQGERYFVELTSSGNHWFATSDSFAANAAGGSLFFRAASGWLPDPSKAMAFDLFEREFLTPITYVQFGNLGLVGGIASLDLISEAVVPAGASMVMEVQIGGVWKPLTGENETASVLASLPSTLPLRLALLGSSRAQPGIVITGSQIRASRPATAMKHFSVTRTIPSATTKWRAVWRLTNWDAAKHTAVPKLKVAGAEVSAGTISDRVIDAKTIERTALWTLGAASATAKLVLIGTSTDAADNFAASDVTFVATP